MATTDAMKKAINKYNEKFDMIRFRVPAGEREKIKEYADKNYGSLNQMLNALIKKEMEK